MRIPILTGIYGATTPDYRTSLPRNMQPIPLITAAGIPLPGSPLLTQGADLGPRRDIRGFQGRKFIGAYGPARLVAE
jgi:hypothetical protein